MQCDGERPICGRCQAKHTECAYEFPSHISRTAGLREKLRAVTAQNSDFEYLFNQLRISNDEEGAQLLDHLKGGAQVKDLVDALKDRLSSPVDGIDGFDGFDGVDSTASPESSWFPDDEHRQQSSVGKSDDGVNVCTQSMPKTMGRCEVSDHH